MNFNDLAQFYVKRMFLLLRNSGFKTFVERLLIIMGPLRGLLVIYHQKKNNNPAFQTHLESIFCDVDEIQIIQNLKNNGFADGIHLPEKWINDILVFTNKTPSDKLIERQIFVTPDMVVSPIEGVRTYPYNNAHVRCSAIDKIVRDPLIYKIVQAYLGVKHPVFFSSKLYWSFPNHIQLSIHNKSPQYFHFDISDSKAVSLFFYLTDVDENSGPHVVVKNTNRNRTFFNLVHWKMDDALAIRKFPTQITPILGKRGKGFFEDLMNYHKHAHANSPKPRLMLSLTYVIQRKPN
jgi:hypothetical protein